jgi:hypothetical protein
MSEKRDPARKGRDPERRPAEPDRTLPVLGDPKAAAARRAAEAGLDLGIGDVETRLPYGSEDIADK